MNIGRTGRYYYLRFIRLKGDPHFLALGASIGVFIGITPTIPLHTIAILAATLLTRSSFVAGLITSLMVCNPLTYIPQYYFSLKIGNIFTPYHLDWLDVRNLLDILLSNISFSHKIHATAALGYEFIMVMLVGGCILAAPFAIASYYSTFLFFVKLRKKRREKQILH